MTQFLQAQNHFFYFFDHWNFEPSLPSGFLPTEARRKGYEEKHAAKFSALSSLKAAREERERKEKERIEKEWCWIKYFLTLMCPRSCKRSGTLAGEVSWLAVEVLSPCQK